VALKIVEPPENSKMGWR